MNKKGEDASGEGYIILVRLVAVALLVALLIIIPARLLGKATEGDKALAENTFYAITDTVQAMIANTEEYESTKIIAYLPAKGGYTIVGYDQSDGPWSDYDDGNIIPRVDKCAQGNCLCLFDTRWVFGQDGSLPEESEKKMNKAAKDCVSFEQNVVFTGYLPFTTAADGRVNIWGEYVDDATTFRGKPHDFIPLDVKNFQNLEYFIFYMGKRRFTTGQQYITIEKVLMEGTSYILVTPFSDYVEHRGNFFKGCPESTGPCAGRHVDEIIEQGSCSEGEQAVCTYEFAQNSCTDTCLPSCQFSPTPCICGHYAVTEGKCYMDELNRPLEQDQPGTTSGPGLPGTAGANA